MWIGTSGYDHHDWRNVFYPAEMKDHDLLEFYSKKFACVEIDSTRYRIPEPSEFEAISQKVPKGFRFTVKTPKSFTHETEEFESTIGPFKRSIAPLVEKGMLGCIVAQFPYSIEHSADGLDLIARIKDAIRQPMVVELKHPSWQEENVYWFLEDQSVGYVNVDVPQIYREEAKYKIPLPSEVVTGQVAYVRFHGRVDADAWSNAEESNQKHAYLYSEEELKDWIPRLKIMESKSEQSYVIFSNHLEGFAAQNADMLVRMMKET